MPITVESEFLKVVFIIHILHYAYIVDVSIREESLCIDDIPRYLFNRIENLVDPVLC